MKSDRNTAYVGSCFARFKAHPVDCSPHFLLACEIRKVTTHGCAGPSFAQFRTLKVPRTDSTRNGLASWRRGSFRGLADGDEYKSNVGRLFPLRIISRYNRLSFCILIPIANNFRGIRDVRCLWRERLVGCQELVKIRHNLDNFRISMDGNNTCFNKPAISSL